MGNWLQKPETFIGSRGTFFGMTGKGNCHPEARGLPVEKTAYRFGCRDTSFAGMTLLLPPCSFLHVFLSLNLNLNLFPPHSCTQLFMYSSIHVFPLNLNLNLNLFPPHSCTQLFMYSSIHVFPLNLNLNLNLFPPHSCTQLFMYSCIPSQP